MIHPKIKCGTGKALKRDNEASAVVRLAMSEMGPSRRRHSDTREGDLETQMLRQVYLASSLAARARNTR